MAALRALDALGKTVSAGADRSAISRRDHRPIGIGSRLGKWGALGLPPGVEGDAKGFPRVITERGRTWLDDPGRIEEVAAERGGRLDAIHKALAAFAPAEKLPVADHGHILRTKWDWRFNLWEPLRERRDLFPAETDLHRWVHQAEVIFALAHRVQLRPRDEQAHHLGPARPGGELAAEFHPRIALRLQHISAGEFLEIFGPPNPPHLVDGERPHSKRSRPLLRLLLAFDVLAVGARDVVVLRLLRWPLLTVKLDEAFAREVNGVLAVVDSDEGPPEALSGLACCAGAHEGVEDDAPGGQDAVMIRSNSASGSWVG